MINREFLSAMSHRRRLDQDEAKELVKKWQADNDVKSRDAVIVAYMPMVVSMARRMTKGKQFFEDAVQEGVIGLMRAVDLYDPAHGTNVGTYAMLYVRLMIGNAKYKESSVLSLKVGPDQKRIYANLEKAKAKLNITSLRMTASEQERVASFLGCSVEALRNFEDATAHVKRLDAPIERHSEDIDSLSATLKSDAPDAFEVLSNIEKTEKFQKFLSAVLAQHPPKHADIFRRYYMVEGASQSHIAKEFGVSQQRISQIRMQVLESVKRHARAKYNA